jgi:predicted membrane-bound dolichyl-phosphate-mannose-protein mannosyltransferase
VGLISIILIGITPIFYLRSSSLLTGIPAAFFILLSLYFLLRKNYWLGGLFSGLAFLTRFPAGLIIIGIAGAILIKFYLEKENQKNLIDYRDYLLIFVLVQVPFLIFNLLIYYLQTPILVAIFRPYILSFAHQSNIFNSIPFTGLWSIILSKL